MRLGTEDMEKDEDTPFDREPWQRLLQNRGDSPSASTDARIRAAARRALAPRAARWWLPASLAASLLLAVLIVQWQYGEGDKPAIVTEADLAAPAAQAARQERASQAPQAQYGIAQDEFAAEPQGQGLNNITVTGSRIGGPERELQAASEVPAEEASDVPPPPAMEDSTLESLATGVTAQSESVRERESRAETRALTPSDATYEQTAAKMRKPEDWYAEIEKLRKAGRIEEADRELKRLKAAYPGWLERHLEQKR